MAKKPESQLSQRFAVNRTFLLDVLLAVQTPIQSYSVLDCERERLTQGVVAAYAITLLGENWADEMVNRTMKMRTAKRPGDIDWNYST